MWNDCGSDAHDDVSVYEAVARSDCQAVGAMSAHRCHCRMYSTAYVLKSKNVLFEYYAQ